MKNNYNFGGVKHHLKFNQRTKSTPHKFQTRFPSQNLILFQHSYDLRKEREKTDKYVLAVNKMFEKELKDIGILK